MKIDWPRVLARLERENRVCLKVREAADIFGVSGAHIVNFIEDGTLTAIDFARREKPNKHCYRIPADSLMEFARRRSTMASDGSDPESPVKSNVKEYPGVLLYLSRAARELNHS
ncbi:MAG TPA: helix-turn-helix domain-containing protein [Opitutaceae bacterium]|jgi:hypothetical protein|nr:helix-turn-helix domain-containing protein [Opitutaceae bacterium]